MLFFTISGWVIAVGMAVWRIVDAIRNRIRIDVQIEYPIEKEDGRFIDIIPVNKGQHPANLIEVGFTMTNGAIYPILQRFKLRNLWVYRGKNEHFHLSESDLQSYLQKQKAYVNGIRVVDERGNTQDLPIPDAIKNIRHE